MDKWIKDRFKFGICDVEENYKFYFKWLLSKTKEIFIIKNLPDTININFLKNTLLLDGEICFTKFGDKLYALNGSRGGSVDEYYRPTIFTIANPKLGSKQVEIGKDGIVVFNTSSDEDLYFGGGLFQLIKQTATLLADNIVSINCAQINSRVEAIITADSQQQADSGKIVLKRLYSGEPYQILTQDMIEKIQINPIAAANTSNKLESLIELNNYIISNYFQSIGIKSNDVRKKERMITDEINEQNDYLAISVLDIVSSWKEGFDRVNEMFGTDIQVELNPVIAHILTDTVQEKIETVDTEPVETVETAAEETEVAEPVEPEVAEPVETEPEEPIASNELEVIEAAADEIIEEAVDTVVETEPEDKVEPEEGDNE